MKRQTAAPKKKTQKNEEAAAAAAAQMAADSSTCFETGNAVERRRGWKLSTLLTESARSTAKTFSAPDQFDAVQCSASVDGTTAQQIRAALVAKGAGAADMCLQLAGLDPIQWQKRTYLQACPPSIKLMQERFHSRRPEVSSFIWQAAQKGATTEQSPDAELLQQRSGELWREDLRKTFETDFLRARTPPSCGGADGISDAGAQWLQKFHEAPTKEMAQKLHDTPTSLIQADPGTTGLECFRQWGLAQPVPRRTGTALARKDWQDARAPCEEQRDAARLDAGEAEESDSENDRPAKRRHTLTRALDIKRRDHCHDVDHGQEKDKAQRTRALNSWKEEGGRIKCERVADAENSKKPAAGRVLPPPAPQEEKKEPARPLVLLPKKELHTTAKGDYRTTLPNRCNRVAHAVMNEKPPELTLVKVQEPATAVLLGRWVRARKKRPKALRGEAAVAAGMSATEIEAMLAEEEQGDQDGHAVDEEEPEPEEGAKPAKEFLEKV
eukprot:g16433.t1